MTRSPRPRSDLTDRRSTALTDRPSRPSPGSGMPPCCLEIDGVRVLTDPVLRGRIGPLVRIADPVDPSAVGRVDCVLLSHLHADHTDPATLRRLARRGPVVAPWPAARWLRRAGVSDVQEVRPGDEMAIGGLRVIATPATHDRRRWRFGPAADPVGYVVRGSVSAYFAGDTDLFARWRTCTSPSTWRYCRSGDGVPTSVQATSTQSAPRARRRSSARRSRSRSTGERSRFRDRYDASADPEWPARQFAALAHRYAPSVEVRVLAPGEQTARACARRRVSDGG